jgi:hypothetical protein
MVCLQQQQTKVLEAVADGLLPRLRPILDEVGTVYALLRTAPVVW